MNIQQINRTISEINNQDKYNKEMGYSTTFYDNGFSKNPADYSSVYSENSFPIKGSNNGQSGFGLARGAVFPSSMNGPFGYSQRPLPVNLSLPATFNNFKYNAKGYNGPDYNQNAFRSIMGNSAGTVEYNPKYSFINGNTLLLSDFSLKKF